MDEKELDTLLCTVHELLTAKKMYDSARLINANPARIVATGCDYFNKDITLWAVLFYLSAEDYSRFEQNKEQMEQQITECINIALKYESEDAYSAKIALRKIQNKNWRSETYTLSPKARTHIFDYLRQLKNASWHGQMNELDFYLASYLGES